MVSTRRLRLLSLCLGLGALAVLGWQYSVADLLAYIRGENRWVVVFGLGVLYLVRPLLLWPLSVFSVFIGYVFGFPVGVPLVLGGTLLTCLPPFLVATHFGHEFGRLATHGSALVETTGELRGMVAARLSPAPADAVSYGAGIAGVPLRSFALGTLVGELPWALFYVLLGRSLRTFSAAGIEQIDLRLLLLAALVSVLLVARPLYEYLRDRLRF
ncbi:TVP38/TMEM64 family protein [Haloplanus aerogenes]|uniref:Putative membrane protein YdjX (TVP38/TMEM64 family) n=1 Tax=Haloplanus aerogenes TaxID=660522 RepID=A0A3M0DF30_9EURY|nr:VTT domain-containing protein [Haloplanus aerogenes]AZH26463.1 TVP38/TMEM64 family protein [Haloplanus aerogenes]RMB18069.1 putative membrane protein YdjX (TVP38/TMEM64 family) [Haloplanus aerogenes]